MKHSKQELKKGGEKPEKIHSEDYGTSQDNSHDKIDVQPCKDAHKDHSCAIRVT